MHYKKDLIPLWHGSRFSRLSQLVVFQAEAAALRTHLQVGNLKVWHSEGIRIWLSGAGSHASRMQVVANLRFALLYHLCLAEVQLRRGWGRRRRSVEGRELIRRQNRLQFSLWPCGTRWLKAENQWRHTHCGRIAYRTLPASLAATFWGQRWKHDLPGACRIYPFWKDQGKSHAHSLAVPLQFPLC